MELRCVKCGIEDSQMGKTNACGCRLCDDCIGQGLSQGDECPNCYQAVQLFIFSNGNFVELDDGDEGDQE